MNAKRGERVAPPPRADEWEVRYADGKAAKGWEELCRQVPGNTRDAFEVMRSNPRPKEDVRHHRLRGSLKYRKFGSRELEQWQIEVTGSGRIWYLVDDEKRTVWLTEATLAHPKATE